VLLEVVEELLVLPPEDDVPELEGVAFESFIHITHIFKSSDILLNPPLEYLTICHHHAVAGSLVQTAQGLSLNNSNHPYVKKFEASLSVGILRQLPQYAIALLYV
jgi:hypothetical protein